MFHSVGVCVLLIAVPALTFSNVEQKITQHRIKFAGNIGNRVPIRAVRIGPCKQEFSKKYMDVKAISFIIFHQNVGACVQGQRSAKHADQ